MTIYVKIDGAKVTIEQYHEKYPLKYEFDSTHVEKDRVVQCVVDTLLGVAFVNNQKIVINGKVAFKAYDIWRDYDELVKKLAIAANY